MLQAVFKTLFEIEICNPVLGHRAPAGIFCVNRRHLLGDLIVLSVMAVIADSDCPLVIATWEES